MLALRFCFLAGHYHGTPWGRHVNEGDVDWPPSPWRIIRALVATWHSKVKPFERHEEETLSSLIEKLASSPPLYALPQASHAHTRHYMPLGKPGKTALIFDAFAIVDRGVPLDVVWPDVEINQYEALLLDDILATLGYLGRAESWVEASRILSPRAINCVPQETECFQNSHIEMELEPINLLTPLSSHEYRLRREEFRLNKKEFKKLTSTLPESFLAAVSIPTMDLLNRGWSQPPASNIVRYQRPKDSLKPRRSSFRKPKASISTFRFLLVGKPLPRVEHSLRIGEALRAAVMSRASFVLEKSEKSPIPSLLSGHDLPKGNRHRHAFFLPFDANEDGLLDHVLVHVPAGLNEENAEIVENLRFLRIPGGGKWRLVLEALGNENVAPELADEGSLWESCTPYLHPWHVKKKFKIEDQVRRECQLRGYPEPLIIERLSSQRIGSRERKPIHFIRYRRHKNLMQPDRLGSFIRLAFSQPIRGPLALGFACHYGLGLFKPVGASRKGHHLRF